MVVLVWKWRRKELTGQILYRFVHNTLYDDTQRQFQIAVESMDPDRLILLLQQNPYHIATLLQVSEIAKQDRNHTVSGDLLEPGPLFLRPSCPLYVCQDAGGWEGTS